MGYYILIDTTPSTLTQEQKLAEFAAFDQQDLIELTNEGAYEESTGVNWDVFETYVGSAEKEFEFYAGQAYALPITLSDGADYLRDIMRRRTVLWKRIQRGKLTEDERDQYNADKKVYEKIASGELKITAHATDTQLPDDAIIASSQTRMFTHYNEDGESELDMI